MVSNPKHSSDADVADAFAIKTKTAKNYMNETLATLGVKNRIQAALFQLAVQEKNTT